MERCNSRVEMEGDFHKVVLHCCLEKDHDNDHKFEEKILGKLIKCRWERFDNKGERKIDKKRKKLNYNTLIFEKK